MTEAIRPFQIPAPEVANPIPDKQFEVIWNLYKQYFSLSIDHLVDEANRPRLHPQYQHSLMAVLLDPYARQLSERRESRPSNFGETNGEYYRYGKELKPEPAQIASRIMRAIYPQIRWSTDSYGYGRNDANNRLLNLYNHFTAGLLSVLPEDEGVRLVQRYSLEAAFNEEDGAKERHGYDRRTGTVRDLIFDPKIPEKTKRVLAQRIHAAIMIPLLRDFEGKPVDSEGNPVYGQEVLQSDTYNMYKRILQQVRVPSEHRSRDGEEPMPFSRQFFLNEVRFYLDLDTSHFDRHYPDMTAFSRNLHYIDDPDLALRIARRTVLGIDSVTGETYPEGAVEQSRDIKPYAERFPRDKQIAARYKQVLRSEKSDQRKLERKWEQERIKNASEEERRAQANMELTILRNAIISGMTVSTESTDAPSEG